MINGSVDKLQRIGKFRLGIKDPNRGFPKSVDYFVINEGKSTSEAIVNEVKRAYGDKPNELNVRFPYKEVAWCVDDSFKRYTKTALLCIGNGKTGKIPGEGGQSQPVECAGFKCEHFISKDCKISGSIKFILEGINSVGIFQIDTGSRESIQNVRSVLNYLKQTKGDITQLRFKLIVKKVAKKIYATGMTTHVPILSLVCVDDVVSQEKPTGAPVEYIGESVDNSATPENNSSETPWDELDRENKAKAANVVVDKPKLFGKTEKTKQQLVTEEIQDMIKDAVTLDDLKSVAASLQQLNIELSEADMTHISEEYDAKWNIIKGGK